MKSERNFLVLVALIAGAALFPWAGSARADDIPIGYMSYDLYEPGVSSFSINNLTGDSALPPDFNVATSLNILDATLVLMGPSAPDAPIHLGTIGPGEFLDDMGNPLSVLQFDSSSGFASATLTGTLDNSSVVMEDGSTVQLDPNIVFNLYPSSGGTLQAGVDLAVIYADVATVGVPEPSVLSLILGGIAAIYLFGMVLRRKHWVEF